MSAPDPHDAARLAREVLDTSRRLGVPVSQDPSLLGQLEPLRDRRPLPANAFDALAGLLDFLVVIDAEAASEAEGD